GSGRYPRCGGTARRSRALRRVRAGEPRSALRSRSRRDGSGCRTTSLASASTTLLGYVVGTSPPFRCVSGKRRFASDADLSLTQGDEDVKTGGGSSAQVSGVET